MNTGTAHRTVIYLRTNSRKSRYQMLRRQTPSAAFFKGDEAEILNDSGSTQKVTGKTMKTLLT